MTGLTRTDMLLCQCTDGRYPVTFDHWVTTVTSYHEKLSCHSVPGGPGKYIVHTSTVTYFHKKLMILSTYHYENPVLVHTLAAWESTYNFYVFKFVRVRVTVLTCTVTPLGVRTRYVLTRIRTFLKGFVQQEGVRIQVPDAHHDFIQVSIPPWQLSDLKDDSLSHGCWTVVV